MEEGTPACGRVVSAAMSRDLDVVSSAGISSSGHIERERASPCDVDVDVIPRPPPLSLPSRR